MIPRANSGKSAVLDNELQNTEFVQINGYNNNIPVKSISLIIVSERLLL